ncbi:MAG: hypothetical protein P9L94_04520 [Candidatus Hinthialibacter antarcticus]|nr:hypothetical protein [Candidatus Hinthialibacter antarcticus]
MIRTNTSLFYVTCCLVIVAMVGCDNADKENSQDGFAKRSAHNHELLNYRIDGPVQLVNQDIYYLFAMLQSENGIPMVVSPNFNKTTVTFSLMNPALGDVFELLRK